MRRLLLSVSVWNQGPIVIIVNFICAMWEWKAGLQKHASNSNKGDLANSQLNKILFWDVWLVCFFFLSVTVTPPDHIQSRPPADSAVWRIAEDPPPPLSCCLSVCLLAWCIQAGAQTHTGESLRLDTTLQHTWGRQRARDGKVCYLTEKEITPK